MHSDSHSDAVGHAMESSTVGFHRMNVRWPNHHYDHNGCIARIPLRKMMHQSGSYCFHRVQNYTEAGCGCFSCCCECFHRAVVALGVVSDKCLCSLRIGRQCGWKIERMGSNPILSIVVSLTGYRFYMLVCHTIQEVYISQRVARFVP